MTESEARAWVAARISARAIEKLDQFVVLLVEEAGRQSLIARSTFGQIWRRHIADSLQLLPLAGQTCGPWVDIGSGGGLPGVVIAIASDWPVILVEPRTKRAAFLRKCCTALSLSDATVHAARVQSLAVKAAVVSARAVASIDEIFKWTEAIVSRETRYLLPRGSDAAIQLEHASETWSGLFHVKQSVTNADSGIVIADGVRQR